MALFISKTCPITGGVQTVMNREDFDRKCQELQAEMRSGSAKHLPAHEYCAEFCCGKKIPKEVQFKTLSAMIREREDMANRTPGTCEMCGQKKNLKMCKKKMVCSTCEFTRRAVANTPDLVAAAMKELHGEKYFQTANADVLEMELLQVQLEKEKAVSADLKAKLAFSRKELQRSRDILSEIFAVLPLGDTSITTDELPSLVAELVKATTVEKSAEVQVGPGPENGPSQSVPAEYASLHRVLMLAFEQAAYGKGVKRHAKPGEPFDKQKICEIARRVGVGYPLGQAIKKAEESKRLGDHGPAELLGAINYLAAAHIVMEEENSIAFPSVREIAQAA